MPQPSTTGSPSSGLVGRLEAFLFSLPHTHPAQIALRTYSLALALSLGPALVPFITSAKARVNGLHRLLNILKREFGPTGFAFSITIAVGGGSYLQKLLQKLEERHASSDSEESGVFARLRHLVFSLSKIQQAFLLNALSSAVAILLLHSRKRRGRPQVADIPMTIPMDEMPRKRGIPPTLDLTLMLFVRAMDSLVHTAIHDRVHSKHVDVDGKGTRSETEAGTEASKTTIVKQRWVSHFDALVFSVCSARIIWCWFYKPERLPPSYVKWISALADIDPRISSALRSIHDGSFSYIRNIAPSKDLANFSKDLGYPSSWGNPALLPAYGTKANLAWKELGVTGRNGRGGIPCELVHGGNGAGNSCLKNAGIRGSKAWMAAIAIYLPVHLIPILLTRPKSLLQLDKLLSSLFGVARSATFLSSFVTFMWLGVCSTRTMVLARLFPFISHDFWDGAYGCIWFASLVCGSSIWLEHARRRGEIALYVIPRAIRTCLSDSWLKSGRSVQVVERLVFILSLATILTTSVHQPDSLRGLSRWTLGFIMDGPSAAFWRPKPPAGNEHSDTTETLEK